MANSFTGDPARCPSCGTMFSIGGKTIHLPGCSYTTSVTTASNDQPNPEQAEYQRCDECGRESSWLRCASCAAMNLAPVIEQLETALREILKPVGQGEDHRVYSERYIAETALEALEEARRKETE